VAPGGGRGRLGFPGRTLLGLRWGCRLLRGR